MGPGLGGGPLPLLSGPDRLRHRLQGVQASPQGLKSLCVRQVTQGILRLLCLSLGGLPGLPGLLDLGDGLGGYPRFPEGLTSLEGTCLGFDAGEAPRVLLAIRSCEQIVIDG